MKVSFIFYDVETLKIIFIFILFHQPDATFHPSNISRTLFMTDAILYVSRFHAIIL